MLSTNDIPLSESALLVVDAQDSFKVDPKWERRNNRQFERNVAALIDAYRVAGRPVIFFLHTDDDPGFERGSVHVRLMDFITVREGEPVILKDTRNTFTGTTLQAQLLALGQLAVSTRPGITRALRASGTGVSHHLCVDSGEVSVDRRACSMSSWCWCRRVTGCPGCCARAAGSRVCLPDLLGS